jgi:multidrug transporter EmrE-like cation transporter
MHWVALVVAGLSEVGWAFALKKAVDGRAVSWGIAAVVVLLASTLLLGLSLRRIAVGTAYPVWVGLGSAGTAIIGILRFGETASPLRIGCIGIMLAAIAGLHLAGCHDAERAPTVAHDAHDAHDAAFVHGMVVFGRNHIYASHLPLYESPHDYQVVLQLEGADAADDAAIRAALIREPLVTMVPAAFDLHRLAPDSDHPLRELHVTLYGGHFERGGSPLGSPVALRVASVLVYRKLDATATSAPRWFVFGDSHEAYLVHAVGHRPDVDMIVAVDGPAPASGASLLDADGQRELPSAEWLARYGLRAPRVVYREDGDLR